MMDGRQFTCDVCGKKEFFPWDGAVLAHYDTSGWDTICDIGDVCPECSKAYRNMLDAWVEERGGVPDETD